MISSNVDQYLHVVTLFFANVVTQHKVTNVRTIYYGTEAISYRCPKIWALVPDEIKNLISLTLFKAKIKN